MDTFYSLTLNDNLIALTGKVTGGTRGCEHPVFCLACVSDEHTIRQPVLRCSPAEFYKLLILLHKNPQSYPGENLGF